MTLQTLYRRQGALPGFNSALSDGASAASSSAHKATAGLSQSGKIAVAVVVILCVLLLCFGLYWLCSRRQRAAKRAEMTQFNMAAQSRQTAQNRNLAPPDVQVHMTQHNHHSLPTYSPGGNYDREDPFAAAPLPAYAPTKSRPSTKDAYSGGWVPLRN